MTSLCQIISLKPIMFKTRGLIHSCILKSNKHTRLLCTSQPNDGEKQRELERIAKEASLEEPPTSCCQSGCANCVYIAWAEALSARMEHATPEIADKILSMVDDPSMKAYLEMELRLRGLKK